MTLRGPQVFLNFEPKRDAYGFTVRPQHLHRYREYANIYREEEEERLQKWRDFLEQQAKPTGAPGSTEENIKIVVSEVTKLPSEPAQPVDREGNDSAEQRLGTSDVAAQQTEPVEEVSGKGDDSSEKRPVYCTQGESVPTKEASSIQHAEPLEVQTWAKISPSLNSIEYMASLRIKKRKNMKDKKIRPVHNDLPSIDEARSLKEDSEDNEEDVFYDNEIVDNSPDASAVESITNDKMSPEPFFPWKEELEFLVRGGVPKDLRGEVWQAFVGVKTRRVERYYQDLLATDTDTNDGQGHDKLLPGNDKTEQNGKRFDLPERWKKQIEKVVRCMGPGFYHTIFLIRSS